MRPVYRDVRLQPEVYRHIPDSSLNGPHLVFRSPDGRCHVQLLGLQVDSKSDPEAYT